jgi:hypothetical protein
MRGDRFCMMCGKYLGNYMIDDFYSLIRKKYCEDCRPKAYSDINMLRQERYRKSKRKVIDLQKEQISMLKAENAALREKLMERR